MNTNNIYSINYQNTIKKYLITFGEDSEILRKFIYRRYAEGVGLPRLYKYVKLIRAIKKQNPKSFIDWTKEDVVSFLVYLKSSHYSLHSQVQFKSMLKILFKFLKEDESPALWIKINRVKPKKLLSKQLLNENDIENMINTTQSINEKCIIAFQWDTGGRIGETLNIKLNDLDFSDGCITLILNGKTGERVISLVYSYNLLKEYYDNHPKKGNLNAPFFLNKHKTKLRYSTACKIIRKLAKRAEINKRINTHFFRKSRATDLARRGWKESHLCKFFGWEYGSPMARIYIHLGEEDLKNKMLSSYS